MPDTSTTIRDDQYFLIIGSMKCATTSLFSYLAEHPAVCPASVKEPEYFSRQERHHDTRNRISAYTDLWDFDPARHAWAMEASTGYTKHEEPGVAERVAAYGIRPRLAYAMRDPFARIESHYNFMRRHPQWQMPITHPDLVQTSNYFAHAEAWTEVFGREALLLIDYEDLTGEPLATVNRVCTFLDIAPMAEIADSSARNVSARPRSEAERVLRRAAPVLSRLPAGVKTPVRRLLETTRPQPVRLTLEQRAEVTETLAPDMARLHDEWGVDTARWGF